MRLTGEVYTGLGLGAAVAYYGMHIKETWVILIGVAVAVAAGIQAYKGSGTNAGGLQMQYTFVKPAIEQGSSAIQVMHVDPVCESEGTLDVFPAHMTASMPAAERSKFKLAPASMELTDFLDSNDTHLITSQDIMLDTAADVPASAAHARFDMQPQKFRTLTKERAAELQAKGASTVKYSDLHTNYVVV